MSKRWYVGFKADKRETLRSESVPTAASHGALYGYVVGPMTKHAASFVAGCGYGAHFSTIAEIERYVKAERGK